MQCPYCIKPEHIYWMLNKQLNITKFICHKIINHANYCYYFSRGKLLFKKIDGRKLLNKALPYRWGYFGPSMNTVIRDTVLENGNNLYRYTELQKGIMIDLNTITFNKHITRFICSALDKCVADISIQNIAFMNNGGSAGYGYTCNTFTITDGVKINPASEDVVKYAISLTLVNNKSLILSIMFSNKRKKYTEEYII